MNLGGLKNSVLECKQNVSLYIIFEYLSNRLKTHKRGGLGCISFLVFLLLVILQLPVPLHKWIFIFKIVIADCCNLKVA